MSDPDNTYLVDAWTKQSELFWRTVYQTPVIATAVFAGWYALQVAEQLKLSNWLLALGVLTMFVQVAILARMAAYLNALRDAAGHLLPRIPPLWHSFFAFIRVPKASALLTGFRMGTAMPLLIAAFFLLLLLAPPPLTRINKGSGVPVSVPVTMQTTQPASSGPVLPSKAASVPTSSAPPPSVAPSAKKGGG